MIKLLSRRVLETFPKLQRFCWEAWILTFTIHQFIERNDFILESWWNILILFLRKDLFYRILAEYIMFCYSEYTFSEFFALEERALCVKLIKEDTLNNVFWVAVKTTCMTSFMLLAYFLSSNVKHITNHIIKVYMLYVRLQIIIFYIYLQLLFTVIH